MSEVSKARLCHVIKNDKFDGYGFNLHAEKVKTGQYIGKVDEGSPAEAAGLREGDRIIEVNGVSIENDTHKQVVQRIKAIPNETHLLVIDPEVEITGKDNAKELVTDFRASSAASSVTSSLSATAADSPTITPPATPVSSPSPLPTLNDNVTTPVDAETTEKINGKGLNLRMTAAELRAQLAAKKKYDPKKDTLDLKKKYEIVQKL